MRARPSAMGDEVGSISFALFCGSVGELIGTCETQRRIGVPTHLLMAAADRPDSGVGTGLPCGGADVSSRSVGV